MITGIVAAAGSGTRMHSQVKKQFLDLGGHPLIWYALRAFQQSRADRVVLVTGEESVEYCRELAARSGLTKTDTVIPGGKERYDSVYRGLLAAEGSDIVLIHDGARPLVTPEIIDALAEKTKELRACVSGMPVKDTIKVTDGRGRVISTPDRRTLWQVHTPQAFSYGLIRKAHEEFRREGCPEGITDDAMLVERYTDCPVTMVEGSYSNFKITTPEDLFMAEELLRRRVR